MSAVERSLLLDLIGTEVTSVVFVADYVQLVFDDPRLTCLVWPTVLQGDQRYRFGDNRYRDALCELIGQTVTSASESAANGLVLQIGDSTLVLNPTLDELVGPEIATLSGFRDRSDWMVWRPGEDTFAGLDGREHQ